MTESSRRLGVVVVNYGSHRLLAASGPVVPDDAVVVVVDNRSTAEERRAIGVLCVERGWQLVDMPDNRGFGAGANAGFERAIELGCAALVVVNPDADVSAHVLDELRDHVLADPRELVTPCLEDSSGHRVFEGVDLVVVDGSMRRSTPSAARRPPGGPFQFWLTGACLALSAEAWRATGGFSEDYFLYWEDVDLSLRAVRAGFTLAVRADLVAVHDEGGTSGREATDRAKSTTYYYWNCRNRLVFAAHHLSARDLRRWVVRSPAASWEILLRGGRRQLLRSPRPLWAALTGTLAGLRVCVLRRGLLGRQDARAYS